MSFSYGAKIVTDGLVFYVDAANPNSYVSGNTTVDSLVSNDVGTLVNATEFSTENNGGWDFDGVNDKFVINPNITLSHLTYSIWYNPSLSDTRFRTLGQTGPWSTTEFSCFFIGNGTTLIHRLSLRTKSSNAQTDTSLPGIINPNFYNTWHNATFVVEPLTQYIYYNGQFMKSGSRTNNTDITINNLRMGEPMGYGYYGGKIASNMIYSRALSSDEVLQNYNALKGRFGL